VFLNSHLIVSGRIIIKLLLNGRMLNGCLIFGMWCMDRDLSSLLSALPPILLPFSFR
jgi:hypothetical protein